jgi:hypothetical protein
MRDRYDFLFLVDRGNLGDSAEMRHADGIIRAQNEDRAPSLQFAPNTPTTVPLFGSGKETPKRSCPTPLGSLFQVFPASVVLRIVPKFPTAVPLAASAKKTI